MLLPILSAKFLFLYVINGSIFEWLAKLSDAELIQVLDIIIGIFKMLNMDATIKQVLYIIDEVERSSVIRSYLEIQFTQLQYIAESDFGTTPYKKKIIAYLNKLVGTEHDGLY